MKSKILSKQTLLIAVLMLMAIITGFALSLIILFYFVPKISIQSGKIPSTTDVVSPPKQEQASYGLPVRLKIPSIKVDAVIEQVGLTTDGAMDTPKNQDDVVWYKLGQRPGENGSAVIAGHYGVWDNGRGSVFDNLNKLRQGDKLYIEDDKGVTIAFTVRESRSYDPKADALDVFGSNDGKAHLNLITCEGSWNNVSKSYSRRLVVFTDKK